MQFSCSKNNLAKAINTVSRAASSKIQKNILECVLLQCDNDTLSLKATDLALSIKTKIPALITEKGSAAVPTQILQKLISTFPASNINFQKFSDNKLQISCGDSVTNILLMDEDEFPTFPVIEGEISATLTKSKLKSMIEQTIFSIAQEEDKPIFTGLLFDFKENELTIVGVDGFRMAIRIENVVTQGGKKCVIPGKALKEIIRILDDNGDIEVTATDNMACFKWDDTELYTRLLDGEFINYENILPTSFSIELETAVPIFKESIERASILAREGSNNIVKFKITENEVIISSKTNSGDDTTEKINAITSGENLTVAFNAGFILDILKNIHENEIKLKLSTPVTPCLIEYRGDKKNDPTEISGRYIYMVMPVQIHDFN